MTKRLIEILGLKDSNPKAIPVVKPLLSKNTNGKDRNNNSFHYRLVIGSLLYLAGFTRPDISIVVHSVAKFSNIPKAYYNTAVKRISKYLLGTKDKGLIYKLNIDKCLEVYIDVNFARWFNKSNAKDPASIYSRTGYIIKYASCLIIWKSNSKQK